jgi:hypothetical protein
MTILDEVWRVRDQISAECGHDVKKPGAMLRREEAKYDDRLRARQFAASPSANVTLFPPELPQGLRLFAAPAFSEFFPSSNIPIPSGIGHSCLPVTHGCLFAFRAL